MKSTFLLLAFTCCITVSALKAQNLEDKPLIEKYLHQSEKQRKTGLIMIGAGAGTAGLGILVAATGYNLSSTAFGGGIILFLAGSASTVIGVPIIISSASKARKAAQLSVGANAAKVFSPDNSSSQVYPALIISFPLNSTKR